MVGESSFRGLAQQKAIVMERECDDHACKLYEESLFWLCFVRFGMSKCCRMSNCSPCVFRKDVYQPYQPYLYPFLPSEADAYCSLFVCIFVLVATASLRAQFRYTETRLTQPREIMLWTLNLKKPVESIGIIQR